jgi:dTDP-glucose 4,6-dehydratase
MGERFLVIGSNSFSGSHFVRRLLKEGAEVLGVSRSTEPAAPFLPWRWDAEGAGPGRYRFLQADLNHDLERVLLAGREFEPGYVVNFAAQSMVAESWLHPEQWYQTNVVANVQLHEGLRRWPFLRKYVHVSTPEVYGSCSGLVNESAPFNPSTPYAASRAACDLHLLTFYRRYQFPVVFTRAANVYGPGQQLYRIIPRTMLYARLGRPLELHGGGHSVRSFIYIEDVAEATLRVAREGRPGEAYHLSTAEAIAIRDLVGRICDKLGVAFDALVRVVGERPGKDAAYLLDSTRAWEQLGWRAATTLEAGLDRTLAWVEQYFEMLREQPMDYLHKP